MWLLILDCFQGGGDVDSGDSGDTGEPVVEVPQGECGAFWGLSEVGRAWDYDFVPDEWIEGWNEHYVVRQDEWNGRVVWVAYNEGKRDTGSARHKWRKERWFLCDADGVWLVHGWTSWTTWRDMDREDMSWTDAMPEPGFLYPLHPEVGDSWQSTGEIHHIDDATGLEISVTSLEAEHTITGTGAVRTPLETFTDALVLESGPIGSTETTRSWLVEGIGLVADDTWLLTAYVR